MHLIIVADESGVLRVELVADETESDAAHRFFQDTQAAIDAFSERIVQLTQQKSTNSDAHD